MAQRDWILCLPPAMLLLWVPGCWSLSGPHRVTGVVGGSLSVQCQYKKEFIDHTKYWCKSPCLLSWKMVETTESEREVRNDRVSIRDHPASLTFTVTLESLRMDDAGTYSCGINIPFSLDLTYEVEVSVFPGEPCTPTPPVPATGSPEEPRQKSDQRLGANSVCERERERVRELASLLNLERWAGASQGKGKLGEQCAKDREEGVLRANLHRGSSSNTSTNVNPTYHNQDLNNHNQDVSSVIHRPGHSECHLQLQVLLPLLAVLLLLLGGVSLLAWRMVQRQSKAGKNPEPPQNPSQAAEQSEPCYANVELQTWPPPAEPRQPRQAEAEDMVYSTVRPPSESLHYTTVVFDSPRQDSKADRTSSPGPQKQEPVYSLVKKT
ncbi:Protein CD300H [Camelus dromedarius]|uniref:Protein CD300H n=1 Tax=Camelus dromedarius TaxID=9838 RepID=A0A5N4D580_CAMDR|nr:Protein CD300H [Camelus dromedarius]